MKKIFTLLFFGLYIFVNAQVTYTENDGPKVGLRIYTRSLDHNTFDLNHLIEIGGNKDWDLRGTFEENDTTEYISVNNLSFKDKYPESNMAYVNVNNVNNVFQMYEKSSNGMYLLGIHDDVSDIILTPKYKLTPFPLNFGSNFQNSVAADYKIGNIDIKLDIQSNSTVDAWGMMITNDGAYPVIKMKTVQIRETSVAGIPYGSTIFSYFWLTSGIGNYLASLEISEIENASGLFTDTSLTYTFKQEVVANNDLNNPKLKLSITPNPVADNVLIECQNVNFNSATYSVINVEGKSVMDGSLNANEILHLNLKPLASGNYLVYLVLDKKTMLFDILSKQ